MPLILAAFLVNPQDMFGQNPRHVYEIKFVCGKRPAQTSSSDWDAVSPGSYYTAVNIYNASTDSIEIKTFIATTDARPIGGRRLVGPTLSLQPRQALEMDCNEIVRAARSRGFLKGFVVIVSPQPLEIVAVYTAANSAGVSSIDVEKVSESSGAEVGCPDLTVRPVGRPTIDQARRRTKVPVAVANIGTIDAFDVVVQVEDPSRIGPERIAEKTIPMVGAGQTVTVTLELTYVLTGSSNLAALQLFVDPKNMIAECNENNNRQTVGSIP